MSEAGSGRDHISGLPDELLHDILVRLYSAAAAARTSVLSRRWRRVWATLPELILRKDLVVHQGTTFLDAVDGALAAYSTATTDVHRLVITMPQWCQDVPAPRISSWLRFASRHLAGALRLNISVRHNTILQEHEHEGEELDLPPLERATSIVLRLGERFLLRPPPPAGTFAALDDLELSIATVEGRALEALVSTQCPRLRNLRLWVLTLVATSDVSLRSGTLRHLQFDVRHTLRLYVAAPALQVLDIGCPTDHVYVAAPNLAEVVWGTKCAHLVFADAGRHLRRLEVKRAAAMAPLMRRFNSLNELELHCRTIDEDAGKIFLDDNSYYNLPKCQTLHLSSVTNGHASVPTMLNILRRWKGIRKLLVSFPMYPSEMMCWSGCQLCRLPKSSIIHDSLEEIEIDLSLGSAEDEHVEPLKQLLFNIWSKTKLKSVETNILHFDPSVISEVWKKIHDMCPPNIRIESYVLPGEGLAKFETSTI